MRRVLTWAVLVALAVGAVLVGRPGWALVAGGAKASLVGLEYMELNEAHRLHAWAFVGAAVALTLVLLSVSD